ncbi:MAG: dynamin family protein, partial [Lachnoclostridium sp.]|nr:dynamin family protein [Lachnoclostridium sp.]
MGEPINRQKLVMKYHPAKKQVIFERFSGQDKMEISETSRLYKYMNQKGGFVLQNQGNEFFEDIANVFAGLREAEIDVVTTKNDLEDFNEMVNYYNGGNPATKITVNSLMELPDMDQAYKYVMEYGRETKTILAKYLKELENLNIPDNYSDIKSAVGKMADCAQRAFDGIDKKFNSVAKDDNIRLCFSGVFSSGKSSIINAILGYPILPEAIKPETAKTFSIQSPEGNGAIRVECEIKGEVMIISWNDGKPKLRGNSNIGLLQEFISSNAGKPEYVQVREVLKCLNGDDEENYPEIADVSDEIRVFFPIPLDDEKVHFTIFDTPGTDAGISRHKKILLDALSSQTHSILIFVAAANNLQGSGSRSLVEYLKQVENSKSKTSIDIGRSLFVINWADAIDEDARIELRDNGEIKVMPEKSNNQVVLKDHDDEQNTAILEIDLSSKRMFFTSAKYALLAAEAKNKIASEKQLSKIAKHRDVILDSDGCYFMQDRCAQSQFGTDRIIKESQKALEKAKQSGDDAEIFHVASGLYALENEMVTYGKKFAAAVRTYAIIETVEDAFNTISNQANMLVNRNNQNREEVEMEIEKITDALESAIKAAREKYFSDAGNEGLFSGKDKDALHLSETYIKSNIIDNADAGIKKIYKGKIKYKNGNIYMPKSRIEKIAKMLETVISDFSNDFIGCFEKLLIDKRDDFMESVREAFANNGGLSDDAKVLIPNVIVPEIKDTKVYKSEFTGIMEKLISRDYVFLWFKGPVANRDELSDRMKEKVMDIATKLADSFYKEYREEGSRISGEINKAYMQNLETFSI